MGLLKSIKKAAKKASKGISDGVKKAGKYTNNFAEEMHLHSIKQSFDVKELFTDPKGYFESAGKSIVEDVKFAGKFFSNFGSGNWSAIYEEGSADTIAAFKGKSSDNLSKKEQAFVREGTVAAQGYEDYKKGDYEAAAKTLQGSQIGLVSETAKKAEPYVGYVAEGARIYGEYEKGGAEGALAAGKKSDIKLVSQAAGYVDEAQRLKAAHDEGGTDGLIKAGKESEVGLISDVAGYADKASKAYKDGAATYAKGKAAYDEGVKLSSKSGSQLLDAAGNIDAKKADGVLSKAKLTLSDRKAKHPFRQDTDRGVGKLVSLGVSPATVSAKSSLASARTTVPAPGGVDFITTLLRIFGLAAA